MSNDRVHHPYSPSSLQTREACPKYSPRQGEDTEASTMGTLQHNSAESGIDDDRLDDDRAAAVAEAIAFVDDRAKKYPGCTVLKEVYLPIDDEIIAAPNGTQFKGTTAGYIDVGIISADETEAEIIDHKFGQWGVEAADNNTQGISYALGLKKLYPKLKHCRVTFFLPHRDEINEAVLDLRDPSKYVLRIRTIVRRAMEAHKDPNDFSMATATVSACLFCANLGRCPAVAKLALRVGAKYAPAAFPDSLSTSVFTDPVQVGHGLKLAQLIGAWAEAYRRQASAKSVESEDFIPEGYTLVSARRRTVKVAKQVGDIAKTFLPPEKAPAVDALYDIALGPLEKLIKEVSPRGSKEEKVKEFGQALIESKAVELGDAFAYLKLDTKNNANKTEGNTHG